MVCLHLIQTCNNFSDWLFSVKMWSLRGGLVHTFRGHSRAVTSIVVHPIKPSIIVTASLDGSVKMWSLNTMEILYR